MEYQWNDNKVIDFVNWYLKLKGLPFNYSLENQYIVDSFKRGDPVEAWKLGPDLTQLQERIDKLLDSETDESLTEWIGSRRNPQPPKDMGGAGGYTI